MIFKTFDSDIDNMSSRWGMFGKSFSDIGDTITTKWKQVTDYVAVTNDATISGMMSAWKGTSPVQFLSDDSVVNVLNDYNKALDKGAEATAKFFEAGTGNDFMNGWLKQLKGAPATMDDYKAAVAKAELAQNGLTASMVASKVAALALNVAVSMGVSIAISALIKLVDNLVHANEKAIEKAEELRDKYNDFKETNASNVKTLNDLKDEFEELSDGVSQYGDNISLTTEQYARYQEIVQQIVGMSPSLAEGYDTENGYIADKNGLLERAIELQEIEYRNELRKITNLDNLKTSMSGYIAEYKEALNGGYVTAEGNIVGTTIDTDFKNSLWELFNTNNRENYDGQSMARDIMDALGVKDIDKEIQKYINEYGYWQDSDFWNDYCDQIANNLDAVTNSLSAEEVGLDDTVFDQNIEKLESYAEKYNDMKDSVKSANESIQTDLGYIAEYADGYSDLSKEQQKFVTDYLKGFDISDITSENSMGILEYDEDKMASVKSQIKKFVEELSHDNSTKQALTDLYAPPSDNETIEEYKNRIDSALEVIRKYCEANGIEIPVGISDVEDSATNLESSYKQTIENAKEKYGEDLTPFFKENSINTQEEIDKWREIAQSCDTATEAKKKYLEADTSQETSTSFEIPDAETLKQQISDLNSAIDSIQSAYDTLNSAVEEYNSNGGQLSIDTIQSLLSLSDEYLACLQVENGQLSLNADAMAQLAQSKLDEAQATAVTQAMTELQAIANGEAAQSTTNYITGNAALMSSLAQLSGSYEGVAQAAMTAAQAQELSAQISAASAKDKTATENVMKGLDTKLKLIQSTKNAISAGNFASVAKKSSSGSSSKSSKSSTDELKEQFQAEYDLLKHNLEMEYITEEDYYNGVQDLNEKYFAGKEEYLDEYRKYEEEVYKGLKSYYKSYCDDMMDYYDKKLDASKMSYKEYCDSVSKMLADMHNSGKISDKDWYDYTKTMLEKQKDAYDRALSAITRRLQKEIDAWQAKIDGQSWEADVLNGRLSTLNDFRNQYNDIQKSISDMAWQSANAQISALNAVKAAEATKAQTSGGSNGYSGSSGNVSSVSKPSQPKKDTVQHYWIYRTLGTFNTNGQASSKIGMLGGDGVISVGGKYLVVKWKKGYVTRGEASSNIVNYGGNGVYKRYASGTDNAKKGWNIVSEENPELIIRNNGEIDLAKGEQFYNFQGGEKVIPANETKEILKNQGNVEQLSDSDVITRKDGSILKPIHYEYENMLTNFIKDNPDYMYSMNTMSDNMCRDLFKNAENVNYDNRSVDNKVSIGEIHLHEVPNVDQFARELDRQLAGIVDQKLSRRKR